MICSGTDRQLLRLSGIIDAAQLIDKYHLSQMKKKRLVHSVKNLAVAYQLLI